MVADSRAYSVNTASDPEIPVTGQKAAVTTAI